GSGRVSLGAGRGAQLGASSPGSGLFGDVSEASPSAPMFGASASVPRVTDAPDLPISNEASGLVNIAHLTAAAFGQQPAGPAFINGHTGRQPALPPSSSHGADFELPPPSLAASGPVVVVAGPAPSGTSSIFKWAALFAL